MSTTYAPAIHDLFHGSFPALAPAAADVDRPRLIRRLRHAARGPSGTSDPLADHLRRDGFRESNVIAYTHRPFDTRWLYVDPAADRDYLDHVAADIDFIGLGANGEAPVITRRAAAELDAPLQLFPSARVKRRWAAAERKYETLKEPNLSGDAADYVRRNGISEADLFHHAVAMLAARRGTPQIPLPEEKGTIRDSALLGYRFASLFADHDPLVGLTPQDQALRLFGVPSRIGKEARMLRGSVLRVTNDVVVTRIYKGEELAALAELGGDEALAILGRQTCDVYLNDKALWRNVPLEVWSYTHHGVPLLHAWIRDRHDEVLERGLTREEVTQFSTAVRRIVSLLLLAPALAKNANL